MERSTIRLSSRVQVTAAPALRGTGYCCCPCEAASTRSVVTDSAVATTRIAADTSSGETGSEIEYYSLQETT